jgi:hypothetical protein
MANNSTKTYICDGSGFVVAIIDHQMNAIESIQLPKDGGVYAIPDVAWHEMHGAGAFVEKDSFSPCRIRTESDFRKDLKRIRKDHHGG